MKVEIGSLLSNPGNKRLAVTVSRTLFYLLCVLLPTQLGKHFFSPFSTISGVRVDYLAPTIYLTDIIALIFIASVIWWKVKFGNWNLFGTCLPAGQAGKLIIGIFLVYLLFNSLFIATNVGAALYRFVKIMELIALGTSIILIRPKFQRTIFSLSIGLLYTSFIAIAQFLLQHSVGGWVWYLGERTFSVSTPAIAALSWGGRLFLRSYATFPHPNVLGGFLAIVLTLIASELSVSKSRRRVWYSACFALGICALLLSFSRSGWVVGLLGMGVVCLGRHAGWLRDKKSSVYHVFFVIFCILIVISSVVFFILPDSDKSVFERKLLVQEAVRIISLHPVFGVGLNNFSLIASRQLFRQASSYIFQPVHNIYLLALVETGVVGFFLLLLFIHKLFRRLPAVAFIQAVVILQAFTLGLFDHYLFTLPQGQLLFAIVIGLVFSGKRIVRKDWEW